MSSIDLVKALRTAPKAPCEGCELRRKCAEHLMQCRAYVRYIDTGVFDEQDIGAHLRAMQHDT